MSDEEKGALGLFLTVIAIVVFVVLVCRSYYDRELNMQYIVACVEHPDSPLCEKLLGKEEK